MLAELRQMTGCEQCAMLSYLIEMAYIEARDIVEQDGASGRGRNKRDAVA